jgi:penicillin amidase
MIWRIIKLLVLSAFLLVIFYVLEYGVQSVPPLGRLMSPFSGFWQNAETPNQPVQSALVIPGLKDEVTIYYDERRVPHIFAKNEYDLFLAQGYITASHRLWQMEFQTHFAAGRISEIVGEKALSLDRMQRRKGLMKAAEAALRSFENDKSANQILDAYTAGINAFIESLSYSTLPLEYKLLNYQPEKWTKLKSALLLKYMADMLTGKSNDIELSNAIYLLGEETVELIYPDFPDTLISPIVPVGNKFSNPVFTIDTPKVAGIYHQFPVEPEKQSDNIGSNNWAVSGSKTTSGSPILCNDPHLQLNLPSIWYEIQLSTPEFNVYGVSLPGSPAVIIGFNKDIAWGVTNGTQDVLDWYKVSFKDKTRRQYLFDGAWKNSTLNIEEIKIKGKPSFIDTVIYTHYGPVVYEDDLTEDTTAHQLAARWMGAEPSNELMTFYRLNKASNYNEYLNAISTFQCPAQNFVFAANNGDIAIWQQGRFPVKWPKQGKYVMDGSLSAYQWQEFIPQKFNPHDVNPDRQFVSSANQHPTDASYPFYYNGFFEHFRNRRINEELASMDKVTIEDMMKLQNDNFNMQASDVLSMMLSVVESSSLNENEEQYVSLLNGWNYMNDASSKAAAVFEDWYLRLDSLIWDELYIQGKMTEIPLEFNTIRMMKRFLQHPVFDIVSTKDKKENLNELINASFKKMIVALDDWEKRNKKSLTWSAYKGTSIQHLAKLIPFSKMDIEIGGNKRIVNACDSRWGPSWRMIVSLENPVKAYGVYPGGQSGNPGSHFYFTGIEKWSKGEYYELKFISSVNDKNSKNLIVQKLNPR